MSVDAIPLICEQARPFYYDLLVDRPQDYVPSDVLNHIPGCDYCRQEVERLRKMLAGSADGGRVESPLSEVLQSHLGLIGRPVSCAEVRPFLPSLADPDLEVRIPTPVTAHLDQCSACAADLQALRQWQLKPRQLPRLTQFLADGCTDATGPSGPENGLNGPWEAPIPCEAISWSDLFDQAFPDPSAQDNVCDSSPAIGQHLVRCQACRDRMKQLYGAVCRMVDRPDSGVVTCFQLRSPPEAADGPLDMHDPWHVRVEVEASRSPSRGGSIRSPMRILGGSAAAAVIMAAGLVLFWSMQRAGALSLSDLRGTVGSIPNLHVATFVPDQERPVAEKWVSQPLKKYLVRQGGLAVLWDLDSRKRSVVDLDQGVVTTQSVAREQVRAAQEQVDAAGFFSLLADAPGDAPLEDVTPTEVGIPDIRVYELTWPVDRTGGVGTRRKCRIVTEADTGMTRRMDLYAQEGPGKGFKTEMTLVMESLDAQQMQAVIGAFPTLPAVSSRPTP